MFRYRRCKSLPFAKLDDLQNVNKVNSRILCERRYTIFYEWHAEISFQRDFCRVQNIKLGSIHFCYSIMKLNWFWKHCIRRIFYVLNVPFIVSPMMKNYEIIKYFINKSITLYFALSFRLFSNKFRLILAGSNPDFASVNEFLGDRGLLVYFMFLFHKTLISSILSNNW
jgi:hypothetical protein